MKIFSIKELENFSDIRAHTIRIWEKRYQILRPGRKSNNERLYYLKDLARLLNISLLNKAGYKISILAKMEHDSIEYELNNLVLDKHKKERELNKLIIAMFSCNTDEFDEYIDDIILSFETDAAIKQILIPFLIKVPLASCKNCAFEIDFAVTTLRQKLMVCIERVSVKKLIDKNILLFLPKGEYFDLILLYYYYLLKCAGYKIMYLGSNIDNNKLEQVIYKKQPHFLLTYVSNSNKKVYEALGKFFLKNNIRNVYIINFDEFKFNPLPDITKLVIHPKFNYTLIPVMTTI